MQSIASDQSWFTWRMQTRNMKPSLILAIALVFCFVVIAGGNPKLLTVDPLTNLPLHPATDSRLHLGDEPTRAIKKLGDGNSRHADHRVGEEAQNKVLQRAQWDVSPAWQLEASTKD